MNLNLPRVALLVTRWVLGAAYVAAGAVKLMAGTPPGAWVNPIALLVISIVEVGAGTLLCCGRGRLPWWCALGLGCGLLAGAFVMRLVGADLESCGCFGSSRLTAEQHTIVAACLAILAGNGLLIHHLTSPSTTSAGITN